MRKRLVLQACRVIGLPTWPALAVLKAQTHCGHATKCAPYSTVTAPGTSNCSQRKMGQTNKT